METVEEVGKHLDSDPMTGYCLVEAAKEAGWDREKKGFLEGWLLHRCAEVIERNPTADEEISNKFALEDEAAWGHKDYKRDETGLPNKSLGLHSKEHQ